MVINVSKLRSSLISFIHIFIAACMLLPIGVIMYTSVGGIKATFLMDYTHTIILYVIIIIFAMNVYAVNPLIGSIDKMYDLLKTASVLEPVAANAGIYLLYVYMYVYIMPMSHGDSIYIHIYIYIYIYIYIAC
jgi:Na+/proline symporter